MDSLVEWILSSQPYIGIVCNKSSLRKTSSFLEDKIWRSMESAPTIQYKSFRSVIFIIAFSSFHSVHHFIDYQLIILLFPNHSFHSAISKSFISFCYFQIILWYTCILIESFVYLDKDSQYRVAKTRRMPDFCR